MKPEVKVKKLKVFLLVLVLLGFGGVIDIFFGNALGLLIFGLAVFAIIKDKTYLLNRKFVFVLIGVYIAVGLMAYTTATPIGNYFGIILKATGSVLIITSFGNDYGNLRFHLYKALQVILIISTISLCLSPFVDYFPTMTASNGFEIKSLGLIINSLKAKAALIGGGMYRNQGPFWEPGILQIHINILIYYLMFEKESKLKEYILPVIILLSTFSTTGFIIMAMLFVFKFRRTFSLKGKGLIRTLGLIIVIAMFIPIVVKELNQKMFEDESKGSFYARAYDFMVAVDCIKTHPLTGIGNDAQRYEKLTIGSKIEIDGEEFGATRGNTNAILLLFVYFGSLAGIIVVTALYRQNVFRHKFIFFSVIFVSMMSEPLMIMYFPILLMVSSVKVKPSLIAAKQ